MNASHTFVMRGTEARADMPPPLIECRTRAAPPHCCPPLTIIMNQDRRRMKCDSDMYLPRSLCGTGKTCSADHGGGNQREPIGVNRRRPSASRISTILISTASPITRRIFR